MNDEDSLHTHIQLDGRDQNDAPAPQTSSSGGGSSSGSGGDGGAIHPQGNSHLKQFYRDLLMVLTEPRLFYRTRFSEMTFAHSLTFSIVVSWIASFLDWITRVIRHETLIDSFVKMKQSLQALPMWKNLPDNFWAQSSPEASAMAMPAWAVELFGILLSPFQTLIKVMTYGLVIFVGTYLLVPKTTDTGRDPVELKTVIKVVAFSTAPVLLAALLGFLPIGLAGFIAGIYSFVLLVIGLTTRFQVSGLRGMGIVILPGIIGFFFMGCMLGVVIAIFYGLFASIFGGMR